MPNMVHRCRPHQGIIFFTGKAFVVVVLLLLLHLKGSHQGIIFLTGPLSTPTISLSMLASSHQGIIFLTGPVFETADIY